LPRDQEIVDTLNFKPKILERKPIIERVADKINRLLISLLRGWAGVFESVIIRLFIGYIGFVGFIL